MTQASLAEDKLKNARFALDDKSPWRISAKSLTYLEKEGLYLAEGDVSIVKGSQFLYAQKAEYNVKTEVAKVSGDVRLEVNGDVLTGEEGVFHLSSRSGKITKGYLFLKNNHYHVSGEIMEKLGEDTYVIRDCRLLTTCDGEKPFWTITGSEVKVKIEGYGTIKDAAFRIHGVPVLYFPYMIFPAKTKRQTGLLPPRMGYSSNNGVDFELPFFWAISDQMDATFYQRYMSKRGYMQGVEFRYVAEEDSKGVFMFDILKDRNGEKDMSDPDEVEYSPFGRSNSTRYWFRGKADQHLPSGIEAHLDADYVSDQDYLKEFERGLFGFEARPELEDEFSRPLEERRSPIRRSALRVSRDRGDHSLQALLSYHQRPENPSNDTTAQPLAGLNYAMVPKRFANFPMYFSLDSDYDYVWREKGQNGHRFSASPVMRLPLWLGRYVEVEPWASYTMNSEWFDDDDRDANSRTKTAYETGLRVGTSLQRVYNVDIGNARRLRHSIWPELSYRYREPQDQHEPSAWFEPIDDEGKINRIRFSLENFLDARLEGKDGGVTYRQWAMFSLSQEYDLEENRRRLAPGEKEEPFRPLEAEVIVRPFSWLDLRGNAHWDHYDKEIAYSDLALDFTMERSGGRMDIYSIYYSYESHGQESLNLWVDVNLDYGFSVGSSLERDLALGENISNRFWVRYLGQCWGIKLIAEREDEETKVALVFQFVGLGDVNSF